MPYHTILHSDHILVRYEYMALANKNIRFARNHDTMLLLLLLLLLLSLLIEAFEVRIAKCCKQR